MAKLVNAGDLKSPGKSLQVQPLPPAPDDNEPVWYVEITKLPPGLDDEREAGINKLKELLK